MSNRQESSSNATQTSGAAPTPAPAASEPRDERGEATTDHAPQQQQGRNPNIHQSLHQSSTADIASMAADDCNDNDNDNDNGHRGIRDVTASKNSTADIASTAQMTATTTTTTTAIAASGMSQPARAGSTSIADSTGSTDDMTYTSNIAAACAATNAEIQNQPELSEELQKVRRLEMNRVNAQRNRNRKRILIDMIQAEQQELLIANSALKHENEQLRNAIRQVKARQLEGGIDSHPRARSQNQIQPQIQPQLQPHLESHSHGSVDAAAHTTQTPHTTAPATAGLLSSQILPLHPQVATNMALPSASLPPPSHFQPLQQIQPRTHLQAAQLQAPSQQIPQQPTQPTQSTRPEHLPQIPQQAYDAIMAQAVMVSQLLLQQQILGLGGVPPTFATATSLLPTALSGTTASIQGQGQAQAQPSTNMLPSNTGHVSVQQQQQQPLQEEQLQPQPQQQPHQLTHLDQTLQPSANPVQQDQPESAQYIQQPLTAQHGFQHHYHHGQQQQQKKNAQQRDEVQDDPPPATQKKDTHDGAHSKPREDNQSTTQAPT
eukprot:CAMPEP_0198134418 /NCGR_PEP_ID=MMETSP1442-20131203/60067_1 /TAXON_ID= /ORGANISM="Craspedostauros australis, Strain CCMP3328" /LENGTH=546 /DNA_ID=CAMNT_0043795561 /DNA_START=746 /DNA_END=2385 /DNA_ORIENTATION=-